MDVSENPNLGRCIVQILVVRARLMVFDIMQFCELGHKVSPTFKNYFPHQWDKQKVESIWGTFTMHCYLVQSFSGPKTNRFCCCLYAI